MSVKIVLTGGANHDTKTNRLGSIRALLDTRNSVGGNLVSNLSENADFNRLSMCEARLGRFISAMLVQKSENVRPPDIAPEIAEAMPVLY